MVLTQVALNNLKELVHSELDGTKMLDEHLKYINLLQELIDQANLIKAALLEGVETIEFGVIDKPSHISLIKDPYKNNEICLRVFVQKEGAAFYYSLNSYGVLWKLKDDKWKEGEDA